MKYRRWFSLALVLCMVLPLAACTLKPAAPWPALRAGGSLVHGSGRVVETKTPLSDNANSFVLRMIGISLRGSMEVELVVDESLAREVSLTADDNIAECISVKYDAALGEIVVDTNRHVVLSPTKLRIAVGAPVQRLDINGGWRFTYSCPSVTDCEISINGATNGTLTFGTLNALWMNVNGAGDIRLAGAAKRADLTINGAGHVKAFDLAAEAAGVTINGAGDCEITATGTLDAVINGVGKVVYGGNPVVNRQVHGVGEVRAR